MKSSEFVFWLRGYLAARAGDVATAKDIEIILAECNKVSDVDVAHQHTNKPFLQYPTGIRGLPVTCGVNNP